MNKERAAQWVALFFALPAPQPRQDEQRLNGGFPRRSTQSSYTAATAREALLKVLRGATVMPPMIFVALLGCAYNALVSAFPALASVQLVMG